METLEVILSPEAGKVIEDALALAREQQHEFVTPEHLLVCMIKLNDVAEALIQTSEIKESPVILTDHLDEYLQSIDTREEEISGPVFSYYFEYVVHRALDNVASASKKEVQIEHLLSAILHIHETNASTYLNSLIDYRAGEFLNIYIKLAKKNSQKQSDHDETGEEDQYETEGDENKRDKKYDDNPFYDPDGWKKFVTDINEIAEKKNPLIGREEEMSRTILTLCRKDKNNPLHVGDPGVGKTAMIYGLARLINSDSVPEPLKGSKIYGLDMGTLVAGTQYRGDFEDRIHDIMNGISKEKNPIVYIDEIHTLIGSGAVNANSLDGGNMLKPYLEAGDIRFIGSTTYEEYNKQFSKSKGVARRFRMIDITEPTIEESIEILTQLKGRYEEYHGVVYTEEAIRLAVEGSARHMTQRRLPDKAIDVIDEAGAYARIYEKDSDEKIVDRQLISNILAKMANIERLKDAEEETVKLKDLETNILAQVYGQDKAVRSVCESVLMAKAGLTDETKPLTSLLFVGPTGVGKTEVAKVLASELGVKLVRFDMSEFSEKHAVAKLIGSPAGYVGYEDGGQLTDAIRRHPDCVLLLDEIEKAHPDIYNILLQVMDYGKLTDNKGNQADFRNVIIIMTSNAGAQYALQANVGFGSAVKAGENMMKQVKKTFKPEFINRLSGTVIFNDMDQTMASLIFDKKLRALEQQLKSKNVHLILSEEARTMLLKQGITREYGAREIERVINQQLKPLLMKEILFGALKEGGVAHVYMSGNQLYVKA